MSESVLNAIKTKVESMTKYNQIEILKIIKNESNISINENKNGVYINLSYVEPAVIDKINQYICHVEQQEQVIGSLENQMANYKTAFFSSKEENAEDESDNLMTVYR